MKKFLKSKKFIAIIGGSLIVAGLFITGSTEAALEALKSLITLF